MHTQFFRAVMQALDGATSTDVAAATLYDLMEDDERLAMLQGDWSLSRYLSQRHLTDDTSVPYPASALPRIGVPGFHFVDGPRGSMVGCSTEFPSPSNRAASFDCLQEQLIGQAIGAEVRAQGGNLYSGVCLNIARHPAWRGAPESYGEDPLVVRNMGIAVTKGARAHVMVGVRHLGLHSTAHHSENGDLRCDEATLHQRLLHHFKDVLCEGGAEAVLCAGNSVNGVVCAENAALLTGIVRERWKLENTIITSDLHARLPNGPASVKAGLDVELPRDRGRTAAVEVALEYGTLEWSSIQRIAERILSAQIQYCCRTIKMPVPHKSMVRCKRHIDLARQAVANSMVLLKNDNRLLPLSKSTKKKVTILGVTADMTHDHMEQLSHVHTPFGISPLDAIRSQSHSVIEYNAGLNLTRAVELAKAADAVVVFVGLCRSSDEKTSIVHHLRCSMKLPLWPWSSKRSHKKQSHTPRKQNEKSAFTLDSRDIELAKAVVDVAGHKTVVVIQALSSVIIPKILRQKAAAILFSGISGRQFGNGLKDVLFGDQEPAGRLPFILPESESQLPDWNAHRAQMSLSELWGYRLLQNNNWKPAYPFGFGLGYGEFSLSSLWCPVHVTEKTFTITVRATNTSKQLSAVVVQIYGVSDERRDSFHSTRAAFSLIGFGKEIIEPQQTSELSILCSLAPLAKYDTASRTMQAEAGMYRIRAGRFEDDEQGDCVSVNLPRDVEC